MQLFNSLHLFKTNKDHLNQLIKKQNIMTTHCFYYFSYFHFERKFSF
ncbi:hypothetical protein D088_440027 [Salmonella enterica subsp. houtenae serovar 16:z4,z32:-- str. RKS3027]|nr:hypothetical protein D088_440027 [Salmonella enterica subsp. houtenae serovar 16:z4,z32:-- str. RKS3027]